MSSEEKKKPAGRITLLDIAEAAGVSKSTVSLVLQNSTQIREETHRRVRQTMADLGYVYNRHAANLRSRSSSTIGVVITDITNPYFAEFVLSLERALSDSGYVTMMTNTEDRHDRQQRILSSIIEHSVAGLILCPAVGTGQDTLDLLRQSAIPAVVVMRHIANAATAYNYVGADGRIGVRDATNHLISLGHRRIVFIGGHADNPTTISRRQGYEEALARHGLQDHARHIDGTPTRATGQDAARSLLSQPDAPTAAVCYNDMVALGALSGLGAMGLRAGKDFSIVGFDGISSAPFFNPPLTTVSVDPGGLGETAAQLLLHNIATPQEAVTHYISRPQLAIRSSSAPVRESPVPPS